MVAAEPLVQRYPGCRRRPAVELSTIQESYSVTKRDRACNSNIDFGPKSFYICSILAQRGRRPEAFLKVERGRRSRGGVRNAASGGAEIRWWGTTTPLRGASLHDAQEEMPGHGSADPHQKIAGGAPRGERP